MTRILEKSYTPGCRICGAPLPKDCRVYCSRRCCKVGVQREYMARKKVPIPVKRLCVICGAIITNNRVKYCSHECRNVAIRQYREEMKVGRRIATKPQHNIIHIKDSPARNCVVCGKFFELTTMNKLCCSEACSSIHIRQKQAEYKHRTRQNIVRYDIAAEAGTKIKPCLKCGQNFLSRGNWICPMCTIENENLCKGSDLGIWNGREATL